MLKSGEGDDKGRRETKGRKRGGSGGKGGGKERREGG